MSQKWMNNYTNTNQGICVSAALSAIDARPAAATHTKYAPFHLVLILANILSLPAINSTSAKKNPNKKPKPLIYQKRTSLQEHHSIQRKSNSKSSKNETFLTLISVDLKGNERRWMEPLERGNESTDASRTERQLFYLPGGELVVHTAAAAALPRLLRQFVLLSHTGTYTSSHMRSLH